MQGQFEFTITDAARFLGKSPVTLRKWERQGLYEFPRLGTDRRLSTNDIKKLSEAALQLGRISTVRRDYVVSSCILLELIERENKK